MISVKVGLIEGFEDQQLSINDLHEVLHPLGIGGRKLLLTMPPAKYPQSTLTLSELTRNLLNYTYCTSISSYDKIKEYGTAMTMVIITMNKDIPMIAP